MWGAASTSLQRLNTMADGTVVTGHRMALSISLTQTVLWDQISYSGKPNDFAWVLPVKAGAQIQLSHDAWFAALDASTATVIYFQPPSCPGANREEEDNGGGFGCGSAVTANSTSFAAAPDDVDASVTVVSQQVVGPYDAVTVRSSQGEALGDWLRANGYAVPESIQPTIDAFTAEGFDFIALRLAPGEGIQAMQPVRVVMPGASTSLPLRMVAAGTGSFVGIELYVLSEGRYHPQNFPDVAIDFSQLKWDAAQGVSTYSQLAQAAPRIGARGDGWLTEYADQPSLYLSSGYNPPLATLYQSTCSAETLPAPASCDAGGDDGGADANGDGGGCSPTLVACDDLDVATNGITDGSLWITRMRANLPRNVLAEDLVLEATSAQEPITNVHTTSTYTNPVYDPCGGASSSTRSSGGCGCRAADSPRARYADAAVLAIGLTGLGLSLRRRRRLRDRG